jgi:single-stranded DNA-binding protein
MLVTFHASIYLSDENGLRSNHSLTRTEWHRVYAWKTLSNFAKTLQKGQLITLGGALRHREVEDEVEGAAFKHRIAEVHATSMKRLSKIETADDPADAARVCDHDTARTNNIMPCHYPRKRLSLLDSQRLPFS